MNAATDIVKELEEMGSPLAKLPRVMPFNIPEGYFSSFPEMVQSIAHESDPVLDLPKTMPYTLPAGYFETFSTNIIDKVTEPVFAKTAAPAFEVPAGYFEGFAQNMLATAKAADIQAAPQVAEVQQPKTIAFRPQWKAMRWAAAAILLLGIGIGSYKMADFNAATPANPAASAERQLAMLDKKVISSYVKHNIDDFDMELLAETNVLNGVKTENELRGLNKQDIQQYLDELGSNTPGIN